jgi:hypothetical protein
MEKKTAYKPFIKGSIERVVPLIVILIVLVQLQGVFNRITFTNRLDEFGAANVVYSFHALPFQGKALALNFSGQSVTVLNVSAPTRNYHIYSQEEIQIYSIGAMERNNNTILVVWTTSKATEGKDYVVSGKYLDFYDYGTRERVPVLHVDNYHELGILDSILLENRFLLSQIVIGLTVLTVSCLLALIGLAFWLLDAFEKHRSPQSA